MPITELDQLLFHHLLPAPVIYSNTDWNLTVLEAKLDPYPVVDRNLVFESYWIDWIDCVVGFNLNWHSKKVTINNRTTKSEWTQTLTKARYKKSVAERIQMRKELMDAAKETCSKQSEQPIPELNEYCGECFWNDLLTCDKRVLFLKQKYKTDPCEAKLPMIGETSEGLCKKPQK